MRSIALVIVAAGVLRAVTGCSDYKAGESTAESRHVLHTDAQNAITRFKTEDPTMEKFFNTSAGYAVFPNIGKGGFGIGGAYGRGVVYERVGDGVVLVGHATLKQGTVGFQLGGQTYSEIIFFQSPAELGEFKRDEVEFSAQASAVAATKGASADADYQEGVAVFTLPRGGLMFEASIGGQGFDFTPLPEAAQPAAH